MSKNKSIDFIPAKGSQFATIESLAKKLGVDKDELLFLSENARYFWRKGKTIKKKDGNLRPTNDAKFKLKKVHSRINSQILEKCTYPSYLQGALRGRGIYPNATLHTNSKVLICEDIDGYFPNTKSKIIKSIWRDFFHCTNEVADVLTKLTSYKGVLPQGWKTSSYLANLVFWDIESEVFKQLQQKDFAYSRFIDDIAMSKKDAYKKSELTEVISIVQRMFKRKGFSIKRNKHSIATCKSKQKVTGLQVNNKTPCIDSERRNQIRASVHNLEIAYSVGASFSDQYEKNWRKVACNVGRLKHGSMPQYKKLRQRIEAIHY